MIYDVIIIGAGAAGLTAAKKLSEEGFQICILEAARIAGGRIGTIKERFSTPVEAGAEFIHGRLPLTLKLLKEAGISYQAVEGNMIGVQNGVWQKEELDDHWNEFMRQLKRLKTDLTILQFLDTHFIKPEYRHLRQAVQRFAEGFDLADISKASILSVKDEWKEIENEQYRVIGGYTQLTDYLLACCLQRKVTVCFDTSSDRIEYKKNKVVVYTTGKQQYQANKLIITVSLGVLQSGSIQFDPPLADHATAIQSLGYGSVIKFLFEFKTDFWIEFDNDIGFLLTDEKVPTWWTQLPAKSNLLTGWLGGPKASEKVFETDSALAQIALQSLSSIFHTPLARLTDEIVYHKICRWQNEPHIKGGYSYSTPASPQARKILSRPLDNTIFFAGEGINLGESQGTVESALQSGHDAAAMLIKSCQ